MSVYHEFDIKVVSDTANCQIARFSKSESGGLRVEFGDGPLDRAEWRDVMDGLRAAGAQLGWH